MRLGQVFPDLTHDLQWAYYPPHVAARRTCRSLWEIDFGAPEMTQVDRAWRKASDVHRRHTEALMRTIGA